jgi:hypothetical protein
MVEVRTATVGDLPGARAPGLRISAPLVLGFGVGEGVRGWGGVFALKPKRFQWHLWDVRAVVAAGVSRSGGEVRRAWGGGSAH